MRRLRSAVLACLAALALGACQSAVPEPSAPDSVPLHSDRGGIGVMTQPLSQTPVPTLDTRRSFAATEVDITSQFSLQAVLNQLAAQNGTAGLSGADLFRELWDTQNPSPGQPDLPAGGPHCSDNGGTLNTFPYPCRTAEGQQAVTGASPNITSYSAVGLFNRFDLAPADGADCGEYRIVFAKTTGGGTRSFIIFEAVLPNPRTDLGLEGCRPVANFWRDLTSDPTPSSRATKLKSFYFTGLTGFSPVVHYANYGANPRGVGQVRVNMFIGSPWFLREFKTSRTCPSTGCTLKFVPSTVKTNPFGGLFKAGSSLPLAADFQTNFFPSQVAALATGDVNTFNYTVPDKYNAGGSDSQTFGGVDDYLTQFNGNTNLRNAIQAQLTTMGSPLTPENIVARAQALSCGGCHQSSTGANLGGGITFPFSAGFVHNTENQETGPEGQRFILSDALTLTFLPHRAQVMASFLGKTVDNAAFASQSVPGAVTAGQTFSASVTMKNTGTTVWTAADGFSLSSVNSNWGTSSVSLAAADAIAEGQSKTFNISATAPTTAGTYVFQWKMKHGTATFGDASASVSVQVQAAVSCGSLSQAQCSATSSCQFLSGCCGGMCVDKFQTCPIVCPPPSM